jgi:hypothetical protein
VLCVVTLVCYWWSTHIPIRLMEQGGRTLFRLIASQQFASRRQKCGYETTKAARC